jgi:hypothetical protein
MTRYCDNIYSGFQALTSATSSKSPVGLNKGQYTFAGAGNATAVTKLGVFPPGTQNLSATLYITNAGSATVSNKITVSAGGTNLTTITSFGSSQGVATYTQAGVATFTYVASACANVPAPATSQTNGGEIPFAVTFLPVSADKIGTYSLVLDFNRADSNTLGVTS